MKRTAYNRFPSLLTQFFDDPMTRQFFEAASEPTHRPAVNIEDTEDSFEIAVLAPGRNKADFKIEFNDGVLSIAYQPQALESTTTKDEETSPAKTSFLRREFKLSAFERRFELEDTLIDDEGISAQYEAGILRITLPKREEVKPKAPKMIEVG